MPYRGLYDETVPDERLPSGIRPIVGIVLAVIGIAGWLLLAAIYRENSTNAVNPEPPNVQTPAGQPTPPPANP
jgi:hypothetical protein